MIRQTDYLASIIVHAWLESEKNQMIILAPVSDLNDLIGPIKLNINNFADKSYENLFKRVYYSDSMGNLKIVATPSVWERQYKSGMIDVLDVPDELIK